MIFGRFMFLLHWALVPLFLFIAGVDSLDCRVSFLNRPASLRSCRFASVRFGDRRSRSTCSTPLMIRSPETSMPPMITRPKTTNWSAVGSPMTRIIWLRPVRKKAAAKVDSGLARPPVSEAPPMTTAAIGPSR